MAFDYTSHVLGQLPFALTEGQRVAVGVFSGFMNDTADNVVMILRGSAGTGKTSVARGIVKAMIEMGQKVLLLAPTGRAAKVLSNGLDDVRTADGRQVQAFTIHRHIYRQKVMGPTGGSFQLNDNLHRDTLFLVDEASMISTIPAMGESMFGSNDLLTDLIHFVYNGNNCRLLLIGDGAQLPPVGEEEAPALRCGTLQMMGMRTYEYDMNEVLRQSLQSGILSNATMIRSLITHDSITELPRLHFRGFADISIVRGDELIEQLASSYSKVGIDETIVVTRSNKRAVVFNQGIRGQVLGREMELSKGDQLMIVKNNYSITEESKDADAPAFLANGDRCTVLKVSSVRELYGFHYADVWLRMPDYNDYEFQCVCMLDTLLSEAPSLTREQQEMLYNNIMDDYIDLSQKAERHRRLREDDYYNALQVKYAYAVTCHKSQGGQWEHVYVDQGYMTDDMLTPSYIHWLYTAFTRATSHLYLVNWPSTQVADEDKNE